MRRTTQMWVFIATSSAVMGCSDDSLTRELLEQQNDSARAECECFFAEQGYASAGECAEDSTFPIVSQAVSCGDRALSADRTGQVRAALQCLVDATAARNSCYRSSGCDTAAIDACDNEFFLAGAGCPEPDAAAQATYQAAIADCVGGGGGDDGPVIDVCPEDDLGSATGNAVASGTTVGGDNDVGSSCGGDFATDVAFSWVAPTTGTVTITTTGSELDTVLAVFEGDSCDGAELDCDDDGGGSFTSSVSLGVTAGQAIVIVVDGFGSDSGSFVLNINY